METMSTSIKRDIDKIKKSQLEGSLQTIRETLHLPENVPVIPFSAEKGTGKEELMAIILDHIQATKESVEAQ